MGIVSGRIGGLSEEVSRLLDTVRSNHGELESHVETSKAFVQATTEHQVGFTVCTFFIDISRVPVDEPCMQQR